MFHPYLISMGKPTVKPAKSMIRLRRPEPLKISQKCHRSFLPLAWLNHFLKFFGVMGLSPDLV